MSTQASGGMEGRDAFFCGAHDRLSGPAFDPRVAALAMLTMRAAHSDNSEVQQDRSAQGTQAGGDRGERIMAQGDQGESLPGVRKIPTGEGYCPYCHFIVGTWRKRLIRHAGSFAYYVGGAMPKSPSGEVPSDQLVRWCEGSGKLPGPEPENMIDPWSVPEQYRVNLEP